MTSSTTRNSVLGDATPVCALERVRLDLSNADARRGLFNRLGASARQILVLSEGLLIYLMPGEVGELAQDLAAPPSGQHWAVDICSPGLLAMMKERMAAFVNDAGAPFLFAPVEGPLFFPPYGWTPVAVRSLMKTAAKLERPAARAADVFDAARTVRGAGQPAVVRSLPACARPIRDVAAPRVPDLTLVLEQAIRIDRFSLPPPVGVVELEHGEMQVRRVGRGVS
jgi:hypothetical protein